MVVFSNVALCDRRYWGVRSSELTLTEVWYTFRTEFVWLRLGTSDGLLLNTTIKFLVQRNCGESLFCQRDYLFLKDPCPNRWLVCYFLCSILTLERRTWEEHIKMNRAEVEWECVGCIKLVHCTPGHEMPRTGQPDKIPVDHILLQVFVYTTQIV
jgi:hypothetical protein